MSAKTRLIFEGENRTGRAFGAINRSFAGMQRRLGGLVFSAKGFAAALGGAALVRATARNVEFADSIQKTSLVLGTTTEELSELVFAAERSGFSFQTFERGVRRIRTSSSDSISGLKEQREAFNALAIDVDKFIQIPLTEQLQVLAERFKTISNETERTNIADNIFGGRGTAFLALLDEGAAGISKLREEAREFGATITGETADAAAASQDSLTNLSAAFKNLTLSLADPSRLNFLTDFINSVARLIGRDMTEAVGSATEATRTLVSEGEKAVEVYQDLAKTAAVLPDVLKAPEISPTIDILPQAEELEEQFSPLQATFSNAITAGAQEGADGAKGVFNRMLQNLFADLAASSFLQLLTTLIPGLGSGTGALGAIGAFLGFDQGGVVPGPRGKPTLAMVHGGETILPTHKGAAGAMGNTYNIDARGAAPGVETMITAAIEQAQAQTTRTILDQQRRGRFR